MCAYRCGGRRLLGAGLLFVGILLIFLCMPLQALVIVLGAVLAGLGLFLIR